MKNNKWLIMFAVMVMFAVGCQIGDNQVAVNSNDGGSTTTSTTSTSTTSTTTTTTSTTTTSTTTTTIADYTSYPENNRSVTVRNNSTKNLVAFVGSPRESNLIGGVPASAGNHGLKKTAFFSKSTDFVLFLVTEEDYRDNIADLSKLDNQPFTRLYAYYNTESSNNNSVYEISEKLGGDCSVTLNNDTDYNVELRRNSIYGQTIGYAGKRTLLTTFSLDEGDYYFFPVFRRFDTNSGEIITAFPAYTSGPDEGLAIVKIQSLSKENPAAEFYASEWITGVSFSSSAAYIRIYNGATNAISLFKGTNSTAEETSTGKKLINPGQSCMFEVEMAKNGDKYENYAQSSQYRIGNAVNFGVYLTSGTKDVGSVFDFYAGKIYTINVSGTDRTYSIDTAWMDVSTDMPF